MVTLAMLVVWRDALRWTTENDALIFRWREHDGPAIAPPMREGLGSTLIKSSIPGATVTHDLKADGLECEIRLPLERTEA